MTDPVGVLPHHAPGLEPGRRVVVPEDVLHRHDGFRARDDTPRLVEDAVLPLGQIPTDFRDGPEARWVTGPEVRRFDHLVLDLVQDGAIGGTHDAGTTLGGPATESSLPLGSARFSNALKLASRSLRASASFRNA